MLLRITTSRGVVIVVRMLSFVSSFLLKQKCLHDPRRSAIVITDDDAIILDDEDDDDADNNNKDDA